MIIKNNDKVLNYVGKFETFMKENETVISSNTKGSYVEFKFTGTGIKYYAHTNAWRGVATIYIDGEEIDNIDLYSQNETINVLVFETNNLNVGEHTIKIKVKGDKREVSKDCKVTFLYFEIVGATETTEDTRLDLTELKAIVDELKAIIAE